jgi:hypothetical protein
MNADDKKLLRKFINERAARAREQLGVVHSRKVAAAELPRKLAELGAPEQNAVTDYNGALAKLAATMNKLIMLDLDPRIQTRSYGYRTETTRPFFNTKDGLCDGELKAFSVESDKATIRLTDALVAERKAKIQSDYNEALKRLDNTVNEALLDLLSKDLVGIRELLADLSSKFDSIAMVYQADGEFA